MESRELIDMTALFFDLNCPGKETIHGKDSFLRLGQNKGLQSIKFSCWNFPDVALRKLKTSRNIRVDLFFLDYSFTTDHRKCSLGINRGKM